MASSLIGTNRKRGVDPNKLGGKMLEFCECYIANGMSNAAQAVRDAGYTCKFPAQYATKLLTNPKVQGYLAKRRTELIEQIEITREELLDKMQRVLSFNLMKYARNSKGASIVVDEEHYDAVAELIGDCVTKISATEKTSADGTVSRRIEIELMSKDAMFNLAMKYKGLLEPDSKINLNVGGLGVTWDELCTPPWEPGSLGLLGCTTGRTPDKEQQ